jgi:PilZ domain
MTSTGPNRLERRGAQRFEVHLPLAVHFEGRTVPAFTQDLSGRGIFFYTEASLPVGAVVELTFTMPSEITLGESMPVRCRGHVLRAAPSQGGQRKGIAVQLDSYEYLPADERPISQFVRVSAAVAGEGARSIPR